jgi:hypothetical protein
MPLPVQQFQILSPEQANPLGESIYKAMLAREAKMKAATAEEELPYAGLSKAAQSASQMAYASLMGPQFMAKLMGNENLLANIPEGQRQQYLSGVTGAASQPNMANNIMDFWRQQHQGQGGQQQGQQAPQAPMAPPMPQQPQQPPMPGYGAPQPGQQPPMQPGMQQPPQSAPQQMQAPGTQPSWEQNVGNYKGTVEEGKAAGGERGKLHEQKIGELGDVVMTGNNLQSTIDRMTDLVASPEFENLRQLPIAGQHELAYYARFGTPEEKHMVGDYRATQGDMVKNFVKTLGSQAIKTEVGLANSTKPNDADMPDVIKGKVESMSVLNKLVTERAELTASLMENRKMSYLGAQKMADKMLNGGAIRKEVHDRLYPPKKNEGLSDEMQKQGYTTRMKSPDGRSAMVHQEDVAAARKEGWSDA